MSTAKKMRLLIVGSKEPYALEKSYIDNLSKDIDVELFDSHDIFLNYYQKNSINKLIFRLGISRIFPKINNALLHFLSQNKFDVIWIFKGMEIYPSTLKKIKESGVKLVNYNADHPFMYFSKGTGNKNVFDGIKYYHHHFSYSQSIVNRIKTEYSISSSWLPFGFTNAKKPELKENEEINKVCFIGNPDSNREKVIHTLLQNKIAVDVYGNGWDNLFANNSYIKTHPPVYSETFVETAQKYRVQLNVFRPHNLGSHNMRTFEMPALGCIMLAPVSKEHSELFIEGDEAFFYENDEELIKKCTLILDLTFDKANEIRKSAYQKSIHSGYSYSVRAEEVLEIIRNLVKI